MGETNSINKMALFDLNPQDRKDIVSYTYGLLEDYYNNTKRRDVSPDLNIQHVRQYISDFATRPIKESKEIIDHVFSGLETRAVQIAHPES